MSLYSDLLLPNVRPSLDALIAVLGERVPVLKTLGATSQDPEWHAEGDVYVHTGMVLEETYRFFDTDIGIALSAEARRDLILSAVLHDLAKPWTTRKMEIRGVERIAAPRHEEHGRSTLGWSMVDQGLPWQSLWRVMSLVGQHQVPKMLVVKDKPRGHYLNLSRKVDLNMVAWLEYADMRGRVCRDQDDQLMYLDLFLLNAAEHAPSGWYEAWRQHFATMLGGKPQSFQDRVFGEAIRALEAGRIHEPSDADFLIHREHETPPELVVLCGPSGSGKSTFVQRHLSDHTLISLDVLREQMSGERSDQSLNGAVRQEAKAQLKAALRPRRKVVFDATNLRSDFRSVLCQTGYDYNALVTLVVFQMSPETYRQRNLNREHAVPKSVLENQIQGWEWPDVDEAHRLIVLDGETKVRGAFGICGDQLPWGLSYASNV